MLLIYIIMISVLKNPFKIAIRNLSIKNVGLKSCIDCVHFTEYNSFYPYESVVDDHKLGRCKQFGEQCMITGEIKYEFAHICRSKEDKCGKNASRFKISGKNIED
jgi:hypothetical protein